MIKYDTLDILDVKDKNNVIIHTVNCNGILTTSLANRIKNKYVGWFDDYFKYCKWFKNGYENQILGTFHRYPVEGQDLIICSIFDYKNNKTMEQEINLQLWDKVIKKIFKQTEFVNKHYNKNWNIHIQNNIGLNTKILDNSELINLFKTYFKDSKISLYIH